MWHPSLLGLLLVAALGLSLIACSPVGLLNATVPDDDYSLESSLAYGPSDRQQLDVYVPQEQSEATPVVVFFYGGSWQRGDKEDYRFVGQALASRGVVAVVPNYRVYPEVRFPGFVEDAAAAVAWTKTNISRFGGDPNRVFAAGHSAGAHIAALLAVNERYLEAEGLKPEDLSGIVGIAGPYAFNPLKARSVRPVFEHLADPDQARPVTFAEGDEPPMLLLHGQNDRTVYRRNSELLSRRITEGGGKATYIAYPNTGHFKIVLAFAPPFRNGTPVLDDVIAFIESH